MRKRTSGYLDFWTSGPWKKGQVVKWSSGLAVLILLFFSFSAHAYLSDLKLTPFKLEAGARPLGLGKAFVGQADDVNAAIYNPGSLPWAKGLELNFKDLNNISACQAYPMGNGITLGIAIAQTETNFPVPQVATQSAGFSSNVFFLSAASKLSALPPLADNKIAQNTGLGINIKTLLGQTLRQTGQSDRTATGWELDAGILYKMNRYSSLGINAINAAPYGFLSSGGRINWNNGSKEAAPMILKFGASAKVIGDIWSPIYMEDQELTLNFDLETMKDLASSAFLGAEWAFSGTYFLRAGYYTGPLNSNYSLGAGIRVADWGLDIASFADPLKNTSEIHFSALYFPAEWVFVKRPVAKHEVMKISDPVTDLLPEDNLITFDDRVLVSGNVKPDVQVNINDQPVNISSGQSFSVLLPLKVGKNLILIDSFLGNGQLSQERKVFRKAKVIVAEEKAIEKQLKTAKTAAQKKQLEEEKKKLAENKERLETLVTMGVVEVSPEASFSIEAPITRGELCSWLVKAANYPLPRINSDLYKDVPKEHPLAPYIKVAVDYGFLKPYPDRTFRPNEAISEVDGREVFRKFGVIQ
ncbi:MAG: S-layer homology domain-containing protein [Candidatus Margulisiibacteriota bacterium]